MLRMVTDRTASLPSPRSWSASDLAECYRCADILARHGVPVEIEDGTTDEGDPWLAMIPRGREDAVIHAARIDGKVVVVSEPLGIRTSGFTLREALRRCLDDERFRSCFAAVSKLSAGGSVLLHPVTILLALVMLTVVMQGEAQAEPEASSAPETGLAFGGHGIAAALAKMLPPSSSEGPLDQERVPVAPRAEPNLQLPKTGLRPWPTMESAILAAAFALFVGVEELADSLDGRDLQVFGAWQPVTRTPEPRPEHADGGLEAELERRHDTTWTTLSSPIGSAVEGSTGETPVSISKGDEVTWPFAPERDTRQPVQGFDREGAEGKGLSASVAEGSGAALQAAVESGGAGPEGMTGLRSIGPIELREAPPTPLLRAEMQTALQRLLEGAERVVVAAEEAVPARSTAPAKIDLTGNVGADVAFRNLAQFALWLSEDRNRIVLSPEVVAGVSAVVEFVFARSGDVQKVLIVDDGPQTVWPYRLTNDIGVMSVDYLLAGGASPDGPDGQAPAQPVLLGLPVLGDVLALGWIAV